MYNYVAADTIFDGVSNIYLISIATAFLAVILVLYCSNFLKHKNEIKLKKLLNNGRDENEGGKNHNDASTELKNRYPITKLENQSDGENNDTNIKMKFRRSSSGNESSDINSDSDMDEIPIGGLVGKLKSKRVRDLEAQLTRDQLAEEKRMEREQLAAIFELLKKQEAELNMKETDETELNAQFALYR